MRLYVSTCKWGGYEFYFAKTEIGLAFLSTHERIKEEFSAWKNKYFPDHTLQYDEMINEKKQVDEYLKGKRQTFRLPLALYGTDFERSVWQTVRTIPYGQLATYSDIARKIKKPQAVRAVANAVGKNPILFVIPCHRVIRKDGDLGGFRAGTELKKHLLRLENISRFS